ncbi:F-box/FBD/LRR-repeat protein At1g13570-like isoform X2 [Apium graveolens]|uniref:F-box/FBD/LRR-repeat protein At1g13570-like isoform X2 n=1 Tax=Apium graveolens TaxID=4045 RepID=UPI003D79836E
MSSDAKTEQFDCGIGTDRISNLPGNLIDHILKCLPLRDAVRTSTLSKAWRDKWVMLTCLRFDDDFFIQLLSKMTTKDEETQISEVLRIVSGVLLTLNGPILEFRLFIPDDLPLHKYPAFIHWIRNISKNGVKILKLRNKGSSAYEIPSYFFSCSKLTHLKLESCILNPPLKSGGFCNLIRVKLVNVTITTAMSFGTQLSELYLECCAGIEHLGDHFKYKNNITLLSIWSCGEVEWKWFECTQKVENLCLAFNEEAKQTMDLDKLVDEMPNIHTLQLDGLVLKSLETGAAVMQRPTTMEKLKDISLYDLECDLLQIQNVLCLIRISPKLRYLYVHLVGDAVRTSLLSKARRRPRILAG